MVDEYFRPTFKLWSLTKFHDKTIYHKWWERGWEIRGWWSLEFDNGYDSNWDKTS